MMTTKRLSAATSDARESLVGLVDGWAFRFAQGARTLDEHVSQGRR